MNTTAISIDIFFGGKLDAKYLSYLFLLGRRRRRCRRCLRRCRRRRHRHCRRHRRRRLDVVIYVDIPTTMTWSVEGERRSRCYKTFGQVTFRRMLDFRSC